ncbi:MAG: deoxyguanosinetriphosphate triphosphohydrolase [Eubacteriales bacterium]
MTIRERLEERELEYLSPYATLSSQTKGRDEEQEPCNLRPAFQRDRDRILHCKSFRRLKQKTQVFLSPKGDHYRTRLTHTLEVAQTARTIAKALRLNEDLVEAIALGHDLGHTPFGHAGERALQSVCPFGFEHAAQGVRVVELLEKDGRGLNLTVEVRDGIRNHQTKGNPSTLEGRIVQLSDKIAYLHHDIDDAIRAGIISENDVPGDLRDTLGETTRMRLNTLINDVIKQSMDKPEVYMSPHIEEAMKDLRQFMFKSVYFNPEAKAEEQKAIQMVTEMYHYFCEHPDALPRHYMENIERDGTEKEHIICDYIAGMTDTYSVKVFQEIFIPKSWQI